MINHIILRNMVQTFIMEIVMTIFMQLGRPVLDQLEF